MKSLTNHEKKLFSNIARIKIQRDKARKQLQGLDKLKLAKALKNLEGLENKLKLAKEEYKDFVKNLNTVN